MYQNFKAMKKVKYYLWLDVRKTLKNGEHPICLVVNSGGRRKFYRIGYSATEKYYEKCMKAKRGQAKEDRKKWEEFEAKAKGIIEQFSVFSFEKFERLYNAKGGNNLKGYFESKISELTKKRRVGTASSYQDAMTSLFKYNPDLNFEDITPDWLEDYQQYMEDEGRTVTTIGMYLRTLRVIYNEAIKDNRIVRELYPFGKDHYIIPTGKNSKKALNLSQLSALKSYEPLPHERFYIDLWWFSFYCSGMNLKDILGLKWKNIKNERIEFIRQKTRRTRAEAQKISIPIDEDIKQFIDRYGQPGEEYILPLYNEIEDIEKRYVSGKQLNKMVNKYIREAAKKVEINTHITLYTARHSYASLLNEKEVPLSYIKEQLGHTDITTTQKYLASIDKEKEKEYRSYLKIG